MSIAWIAIFAVVVGLLGLVLFALMKTANEHDRAARHAERALRPFSNVPVTHVDSAEAGGKDRNVST